MPPFKNDFFWLQPGKKAKEGLKELFIHPPAHCVTCSSKFAEKYDHDVSVFHGKAAQQKLGLATSPWYHLFGFCLVCVCACLCVCLNLTCVCA